MGCASKEEIKQRQKNAFDVSGEYTTVPSSPTQLTFKITNESERYDIRLEIPREGLTSSETEFFKRQGIEPQGVIDFFSNPMVLGAGKQNEFEGGENISDDFGVTSRLYIHSNEFAYSGDLKIQYRFSATVKKSDFVMRGSLTASVLERKTETDQSGKTSTYWGQRGELGLTFEARNGDAFFKQYFGNWSGSVTRKTAIEGTFSAVSGLRIDKIASDSFRLNPSQRSITYQGKNFEFIDAAFPIGDLSDQEFPTIEMRFNRLGTDERLVFFGNVMSLGDLTGSVVYIQNGIEESVGSFQFKKD